MYLISFSSDMSRVTLLNVLSFIRKSSVDTVDLVLKYDNFLSYPFEMREIVT